MLILKVFIAKIFQLKVIIKITFSILILKLFLSRLFILKIKI